MSEVASWYCRTASKYQSAASTELYCGASSAALRGKRSAACPDPESAPTLRRIERARSAPPRFQRQPGQRDHGVAAPLAEPRVAGRLANAHPARCAAGGEPEIARRPTPVGESTAERRARPAAARHPLLEQLFFERELRSQGRLAIERRPWIRCSAPCVTGWPGARRARKTPARK